MNITCDDILCPNCRNTISSIDLSDYLTNNYDGEFPSVYTCDYCYIDIFFEIEINYTEINVDILIKNNGDN